MDVDERFLSATLKSEADSLRRALTAVVAEATAALHRMDEGGRPSSSVTGRLLPSASDVEQAAGKVDLLLNWAGSPVLSKELAVKALVGKA